MNPNRRAALRIGAWGVFLGTCVLYALALNPYVLPGTYDNVLYHVSSRSLVETGSFTFGGWSIWDWPPVFPAMLSVPMMLGIKSVLASKLVVYVTVAATAALALAVLRREKRPWAIFSVSIAVLVPTAFLQGTRVMSDWPFAALGFLFLFLLEWPRLDRPSWPLRMLLWAPVLGFVLGAASLTRNVGVCLGAALVVRVWRDTRRAAAGSRLRALLPGVLVAVVGGGMFIGWRLLILPHLHAAESWADYQKGLSFIDTLSPIAFAKQVLDITTHGSWLVARVFGDAAGPVAAGVAVGVTGLVVYGAFRQIRSHGLRPSDAYVIASALLVTTIEWKHARYLLPIAPFLASYLTWGIEGVFGWVWAHREQQRWWAVRGAVGVWLLVLVAMDAFLVVWGNDETHRGLNPLASPTAESFYLGEWHDLEQAAAYIRSDPRDGTVLMVGRNDLKYPAFFTGRPIARLPDAPPATAADGDGASGPGRELTPDVICDLQPPFRPGHGLTLYDQDGEATPPLWRPENERRRAPGRCDLTHVLVQGDAPLPPGIAEPLGLGAPATFGVFRVYEVPPTPPALRAGGCDTASERTAAARRD